MIKDMLRLELDLEGEDGHLDGEEAAERGGGEHAVGQGHVGDGESDLEDIHNIHWGRRRRRRRKRVDDFQQHLVSRVSLLVGEEHQQQAAVVCGAAGAGEGPQVADGVERELGGVQQLVEALQLVVGIERWVLAKNDQGLGRRDRRMGSE